MAALLRRSGAFGSSLASLWSVDRFTAACLRLDRAEAEELAKREPQILRSADAITLAAQRDRADVVTLLLDLGVSADVASSERAGEHPLHTAAYFGSVDAAKALIDRGAEIDPREGRFGATPLGFAVWASRRQTIDLLAPRSRDIWNVAFTGHVARVRELLGEEPALASAVHPDGESPLMRLPADEDKAIEIVRLFRDRGADVFARNGRGESAAEIARARGMLRVEGLLS
jgi:ankyrin repeat protein